jgi:3-oxoacyl-[acyl-carrier protein] reductase
VNAVTKSLASELGPRGIRVNAVNPGMVETEGFTRQASRKATFGKPWSLRRRSGASVSRKDIAPLVAFLASADASWITGETYHVSGGFR